MEVIFQIFKFFNCVGLYWTGPTKVTKQVLLISSFFTTFPGGGSGLGWVGEIKIKANSAQLKLELGLSLAILTDLT